jgi:chaperonin GroES
LLVKRIESNKTSKGGIIIPENAKEEPREGIIVELGNGVRTKDGSFQNFLVKVGDKVLFAKYSETEVSLNNEEYLLIKEEDILAVIK